MIKERWLDDLDARARPIALAGFRACAEAITPPTDLGAPTVDDVDLTRRFDRWLDELPPESRRLMLLLYGALELLGPVAVPALGRLSRVPLAKRIAFLERWRASSLAPLRFVGEAAKSPVVMMYLAEPAALRWLGAPARGCK